MIISALDYPAINGRPVTEAHAKYCRDNGHAKHLNNGVRVPYCPRCGDLVESANVKIYEVLADGDYLMSGIAPSARTAIARIGRWTEEHPGRRFGFLSVDAPAPLPGTLPIVGNA